MTSKAIYGDLEKLYGVVLDMYHEKNEEWRRVYDEASVLSYGDAYQLKFEEMKYLMGKCDALIDVLKYISKMEKESRKGNE